MSTMSRLDAVVQDIDRETYPYTRAAVELVIAVLVENPTVMLEALREIVAVCDQAAAPPLVEYHMFCSLDCNREYHAVTVLPADGNDEPFCLNCGGTVNPLQVPHPAPRV